MNSLKTVIKYTPEYLSVRDNTWHQCPYSYYEAEKALSEAAKYRENDPHIQFRVVEATTTFTIVEP